MAMTTVERAPPASHWRAGAKAVAVLTFEIDAEGVVAGGDAEDLSAMSHHAYGPRIGVPRLLQTLGQLKVPATFFVPGAMAERWPATVEAILLAGNEVALHGHEHRHLTLMSADQQRADFERGMSALAACGATPKGYRAPYAQLAAPTLDLIARADLLYDSSLMDDDRPYRLRVHGRTIAELPVQWALDDSTARQRSAVQALELWKDELDAMRSTGSLCVVRTSTYLSGRPSGVRAIEGLVGFARDRGDVRFERADAVAAKVVGQT